MSFSKIFLHVCFSFLIFSANLRAMMGPADDPEISHSVKLAIQKEAEEKFPFSGKIYSFEELKNIFNPIIHPRIKDEFEKYFLTSFYSNVSQPARSNQTIIQGYQYLYTKMVSAREFEDDEKTQERQWIILDALLMQNTS